MSTKTRTPVMAIRNLVVDYVTQEGPLRVVDGVSLDVHAGELLGLAGESGSGKSTLALAAMRALGAPGVIRGGEVLLSGDNGVEDLLRMSPARLQEVRWSDVAMVVQSAMGALNPVLKVRDQIIDALVAHGVPKARHAPRVAELMQSVSLPPETADAYPHQLSGGMRQRVVIAMAIALRPRLLWMDEPTTALDVIVEREILELVAELSRKEGFGVVLITHDLPRMLEVCDTVAIMYGGRLAELATVDVIHRGGARHPYTSGLMAAFPSLHGDESALQAIPGDAVSLRQPPTGCRFHPRCARAQASSGCMDRTPPWRQTNRLGVACHRADEPE